MGSIHKNSISVEDVKDADSFIENEIEKDFNTTLTQENPFTEGYIVMKMVRQIGKYEGLESGGSDILSPFILYFSEKEKRLYVGAAAYLKTPEISKVLPESFKLEEFNSYLIKGRVPVKTGDFLFRKFDLDYYVISGQEKLSSAKKLKLLRGLASEETRLKLGHGQEELGCTLFDEFLKTDTSKIRPAKNDFEKILEAFNNESVEISRSQALQRWDRIMGTSSGFKGAA